MATATNLLTQCSACFAQIPKQSSYCPHCGHPQDKGGRQFIPPPRIQSAISPQTQVPVIQKKPYLSSISLKLIFVVMGLGILGIIVSDFDESEDKNKLQASILSSPSPTVVQKPSPTPTPTAAGKRRRDFAWSLSDRIDRIMSGVTMCTTDSEYTSLFIIFDEKITEEKARYYLFNLLRVNQLKKLGVKEITITGRRFSENYTFDLNKD